MLCFEEIGLRSEEHDFYDQLNDKSYAQGLRNTIGVMRKKHRKKKKMNEDEIFEKAIQVADNFDFFENLDSDH